MLLRTYVHCLDEGEHEALRRIQKTLKDASGPASAKVNRAAYLDGAATGIQ